MDGRDPSAAGSNNGSEPGIPSKSQFPLVADDHDERAVIQAPWDRHQHDFPAPQWGPMQEQGAPQQLPLPGVVPSQCPGPGAPWLLQHNIQQQQQQHQQQHQQQQQDAAWRAARTATCQFEGQPSTRTSSAGSASAVPNPMSVGITPPSGVYHTLPGGPQRTVGSYPLASLDSPAGAAASPANNSQSVPLSFTSPFTSHSHPFPLAGMDSASSSNTSTSSAHLQRQHLLDSQNLAHAGGGGGGGGGLLGGSANVPVAVPSGIPTRPPLTSCADQHPAVESSLPPQLQPLAGGRHPAMRASSSAPGPLSCRSLPGEVGAGGFAGGSSANGGSMEASFISGSKCASSSSPGIPRARSVGRVQGGAELSAVERTVQEGQQATWASDMMCSPPERAASQAGDGVGAAMQGWEWQGSVAAGSQLPEGPSQQQANLQQQWERQQEGHRLQQQQQQEYLQQQQQRALLLSKSWPSPRGSQPHPRGNSLRYHASQPTDLQNNSPPHTPPPPFPVASKRHSCSGSLHPPSLPLGVSLSYGSTGVPAARRGREDRQRALCVGSGAAPGAGTSTGATWRAADPAALCWGGAGRWEGGAPASAGAGLMWRTHPASAEW